MGASGGPHERHAKTLIVFFSIFFGLGDFNMRVAVTKRIGIFFLLLVLLFSLTFGFLNKPIKTHALPIAAIALGSGALGAVVAAYFATAGVQLSGSGDTDGNFLGNYIANWVKNSSGYVNNSYFDTDGNFIGDSNDLSVVQNNDNGLVSFIFGKEFAIWLEALKQSFVSEKNLSVDSTTTLDSSNSVSTLDGDFYLFNEVALGDTVITPNSNYIINARTGAESYVRINENVTVYLYCQNVEYQGNYYTQATYAYTLDNFENISSGTINVYNMPRNFEDLNCQAYFYNNVTVNNPRGFGIGFFRPYYFNNVYQGYYFQKNLSIPDVIPDVSSIGLEGSLTDGYEDFEEAINQDLTNADEEEVAVVDVGTFPEVLDPSALVDGILDKIIDGTLNPEYDGTRENTESAEEEKEGSKPFNPTVPEGWVIVNGLEDFFPFCIPWDLYNLIAELNVPAKAPKFTYKVDLDAAIDGLEYDAVLDLAPFESVAQIFRILCVIGFVFFLILKTRDLIRG